MKKLVQTWTVDKLQRYFSRINFPEYQREPTVWSRAAKQRLIDSMLRQFDVAPIYAYNNDDGTYDCIDGRQRIGAIMSFLGANPKDDDNGFDFRIMNEIYDDESHQFSGLDGCDYADAEHKATQDDHAANKFLATLKEYELTVIELSQSKRPEEFNLQFIRLNLGVIINSGEKLHAMVGELRDVCFGPTGLGQHRFLGGVSIPTRRYSREQVAAQILAQVFALETTTDYTRTRHFDLQKFFKENAKLDVPQRKWVNDVRLTLNVLADAFDDLSVLANRAITVSTVLLAWKLGLTKKASGTFARFIGEFLCRLRWQVQKSLDVDTEYRYLMEFQRHVTQAAVEKPAVQARAATLEGLYKRWKTNETIQGDVEYLRRTKKDPQNECRRSG